MSKHTKGNWEAERISYNWMSQKEKGMAFRIKSPDLNLEQQDIGVLYYKPMFEEAEANANLIAATPDLLEACKLALSMVQEAETEKGYANSYEVALAGCLKSAIAKAEGEE